MIQLSISTKKQSPENPQHVIMPHFGTKARGRKQRVQDEKHNKTLVMEPDEPAKQNMNDAELHYIRRSKPTTNISV